MDDNNVQEGAVSEGTVSQEGEVSEGTPQQEPEKAESKSPTTEQINQMIKSALAEQARQYGRSTQSLTDQIKHLKGQLAETTQRADTTGGTLESIRGRIKDADPDLLKELELAELRTKAQQYEKREFEQTSQAQRADFDKRFHSQLGDLLEGFEIDPTDERIDWGNDAKDYIEKQGRILASVKKIHAEQIKNEKQARTKEFDNFKLNLRKELGLDKVDTSNPVNTSSDVEWLRKWGDGEIEATPQNLKKAVTLQNKLYGG